MWELASTTMHSHKCAAKVKKDEVPPMSTSACAISATWSAVMLPALKPHSPDAMRNSVLGTASVNFLNS